MPPIAPSMSGENVEKFHVIGVLISMALYGLYSCLYLQTLYHLKRASARPALLFIGLTTLWIFTTLVTVLRAWCLYQALIPLDGVTTANEYYAQWYQPWESVVTMVIVHATCLLGNTFICWRLYVLWKRDARILIAPVILLTCYVVVATMSVVYAVKSKTSQRYAPIRNGLQLGTAIGALTVNAVLVSLMCWKVWRVSRSVSQLSPVTGSFYERALHILIESGAGYFIVVSASISTKGAGLLNANIIVIYMIPQVFSLVPTLIILRLYTCTPVSQGATGHDTVPPTSQRVTISRPVFARPVTSTAMTQLSDLPQSLQFKPASTLESWNQSRSAETSELTAKSDSKSHYQKSDL